MTRLAPWIGASGSFAWAICASYEIHPPWLVRPEPAWHWWVQGAFFLGFGLGRLSVARDHT